MLHLCPEEVRSFQANPEVGSCGGCVGIIHANYCILNVFNCEKDDLERKAMFLTEPCQGFHLKSSESV